MDKFFYSNQWQNILKCRRTDELEKTKTSKQKNPSQVLTGIFRYLSNSMKDFKCLTLWTPLHLRKLVTQFFSSQKTTFFSCFTWLEFQLELLFPTVYSEVTERERSNIFLMDDGVSSKGLRLANFQSATSSVSEYANPSLCSSNFKMYL